MSTVKEVPQAVREFLERVRAQQSPLVKIELATLGTVYLRKPTGEDQLKISAIFEAYEAHKLSTIPESAYAATMGAALLLQENGEPFFEDAVNGYELLSKMNVAALKELYLEIEKVAPPVLTKKALESAEKKSSSDQTSPSGSN